MSNAMEMTVAEWRNIFGFSYDAGDVVIKKTKVRVESLTVPSHIGEKRVRTIDSGALFFGRRDGLDFMSPTEIIVSEGIEEICSGAFSCVEDADVYIPSTVTSLPKNMFCASEGVTLHLTAAVTQIADGLAIDSFETGIAAIHAPAGSYAETYAKENNIPFVAE
jgi:hypothetical protein